MGSLHLTDEVDVGSGEKTPGQQDTDAIVEQVCTHLLAAGLQNIAGTRNPGAARKESAQHDPSGTNVT